MHKGRLYELCQEFRIFNGEAPYPHWFPQTWLISTASWAGSAASLVPAAPLDLVAVGVDSSLRAVYECPLFDSGGGVYATLKFYAYLTSPTTVEGRVGGDWGVNGELPDIFNYHTNQPSQPLSKFFTSGSTPAEAYLRPTHLIWAAKPY